MANSNQNIVTNNLFKTTIPTILPIVITHIHRSKTVEGFRQKPDALW
jgi:hypothetical protein